MKKLACVIIIGIMLIASTSFSYTYDGDINPEEFIGWYIVEKLVVDEYRTTIWIKNNRIFEKIKFATLHLFNGTIMWYTYWKYGTLYTFEYNVKTNNFDLVFVLQVE